MPLHLYERADDDDIAVLSVNKLNEYLTFTIGRDGDIAHVNLNMTQIHELYDQLGIWLDTFDHPGPLPMWEGRI